MIKITKFGFVYYIRDKDLKNYDVELMGARQLTPLSVAIIVEDEKELVQLTDKRFGVN